MSKYPILTNSSYQTVPALSDLQSYSPHELSSVDFAISNQYGRIKFLSKVNLNEVNLDETIEIKKSSIEVYKSSSPPQGEGLNVRSELTLFSLSKSLSKVKSHCKSLEAKLLFHSSQTGEVRFEVPHFTRYAFQIESSSEEEDESELTKRAEMHLEVPVELDSSSHQSNHRIEEIESNLEVEKELDLRLDFTKKFQFGISPQGLMYLPGMNQNLRGIKLCFENEQAEKGLDVQMTQILNASESSLNSVTHLENIWYSMAHVYLMDSTYEGISNEQQVWTLFNVLFGSPFVDVNNFRSSQTPRKEGYFNEAQKEVLRKKAFFTWIKRWKKTENLHDAGSNILNRLACSEIGAAAAEACKSGHLHLASLISLTPTEFTKSEISLQLDTWKNAKICETFNNNILLIYEVLAGRLKNIPVNLTWQEKLSLILQFQVQNFHSLSFGVNEFFDMFSKNTKMASSFNEKFEDFCLLLLKFYSNPGVEFSADMLNPFTFQSHFSLGMTWLIYYSLFTLFQVSEEYYQKKSEKTEKVFENLQFVTEAFAEELVNSGKWQLAVYVLKYSKNPERLGKTLINRNVYVEDFSVHSKHMEHQSVAIESARALFNKHCFDFKKAFDGYLFTSEVSKASDVVIQDLAPMFIIKYQGRILYEKLYVKVLKRIEDASFDSNVFLLEEEIYMEFTKLAQYFDLKEKPETDEQIAELLAQLDKLNFQIVKLPLATHNQKIAISIMQTNLNQWKLKILALRDKVRGMIHPEMLTSIDHCKDEDILRFCENIGFRYLKSIVRE